MRGYSTKVDTRIKKMKKMKIYNIQVQENMLT